MAYDFATDTGRIAYGNPSYLNDIGPLTYAAWVQRDTAGGGGFGRILVKDNKKSFFGSSTEATVGNFSFSVAASTATHQKYGASDSFPNAATTWVHLAATWDGTLSTSASALYKNGSASTPYFIDNVGSGSITSDASGDLTIGNRSDGLFDRGFDGRICELAIWNVALTAEEVASLAKGFKPRRVRPQSLVFYTGLIRDANEIRNATSSTVSGPAPAGYHPRVY